MKRRKPLRRQSRKTARRTAACRDGRRELVLEVGRCEVCGHNWLLDLDVHEIANGPHRLMALDKRFALLVACWPCNSEQLTDKRKWPVSRQLSLLKKSRPADYDLEAYVATFHPRAPRVITQDEVDEWEARGVH